jgi:hypothetical protein
MTKRRRGHSEGHIYRRSDGRWEAKIDLGWHAGRRVRKSIYARSRAEVAQLLAAALRDHNAGIPPAIAGRQNSPPSSSAGSPTASSPR